MFFDIGFLCAKKMKILVGRLCNNAEFKHLPEHLRLTRTTTTMLRVASSAVSPSSSLLCRLQSTAAPSQPPVESQKEGAVSTVSPKEPVAADVISGAPCEQKCNIILLRKLKSTLSTQRNFASALFESLSQHATRCKVVGRRRSDGELILISSRVEVVGRIPSWVGQARACLTASLHSDGYLLAMLCTLQCGLRARNQAVVPIEGGCNSLR